MSRHHQNSASGSSGRSSMNEERLEELEALNGEALLLQTVVATPTPISRLPQTNTDNWIHMSLLNGLTLSDQDKEHDEPVFVPPSWNGYGVGSDSGLGHEDNNSNVAVSKRRLDSTSYFNGFLPKPPSYWKFAICLTLLNPPFGLMALYMCHLTRNDVRHNRLLKAKRRSKRTLYIIIAGIATFVLALVLTIVILTAHNKHPFRQEPSVRKRKKYVGGIDLGYDPPPNPRIERKRPRPKKPPPPPIISKKDRKNDDEKQPDDFFARMADSWQGANVTAYDFASRDKIAQMLDNTDVDKDGRSSIGKLPDSNFTQPVKTLLE